MNECPCYYTPTDRARMQSFRLDFNEIFRNLTDKWNSKNITDFAVISHPLLTNFKLQHNDLSPLDCFHPTELSDAMFARNYWNSLLTPKAKKKDKYR